MSTASLTALVTAITGLVAAAATLIGVVRHVTGPAHATTTLKGEPQQTPVKVMPESPGPLPGRTPPPEVPHP